LFPQEAAELSDAFLGDLLARTSALPRFEVRVALPEEASLERMRRRHAASAATWMSQGEGDLGQRLDRVARAAFDEGARGVVLLGSDHPNLPSALLLRCLEIVERGGAAWIRTDDGGYAAMALSSPCAEIFQDIPWSTSKVGEATLERAAAAGLTLEDAGCWYDVDRPADLFRLERDLKNDPSCPRTSALLGQWKLESRKEGIF
jgi:glycosyltransferase A (GT-A) superfamily protein (DUF2064 family)